MRGNVSRNPVSLLSFLLVPFKAKPFLYNHQLLTAHYKAQIQQGIKSDSPPSPPSPIPQTPYKQPLLTVWCIHLTVPFHVLHTHTHTQSCFVKYHINCSTSCFSHLAMYLGSLSLVLCIISPYFFELLHSTAEYSCTIRHPLPKTHSTPLY